MTSTPSSSRPSVDALVHLLAERELLHGVSLVCRMFHVLPEEVLGDIGSKQVRSARWAVYAHLQELGFSHGEIGRLMGRDRTTVLHGLRKAAPCTS